MNAYRNGTPNNIYDSVRTVSSYTLWNKTTCTAFLLLLCLTFIIQNFQDSNAETVILISPKFGVSQINSLRNSVVSTHFYILPIEGAFALLSKTLVQRVLPSSAKI